MKAYVKTPSGRKVEFGPDEKVRFECDESGTHWLGALINEHWWLCRELHDLHPGMVIKANALREWKWEQT